MFATLDGVSRYLNGPQNLSNLGLPNEIMKLDAAFVWGKNEKTYLFDIVQFLFTNTLMRYTNICYYHK